MSNAAESLATILESWSLKSNRRNLEARFSNNQSHLTETWREQALAVELLREVDRSLDRLEELGQSTKNVDAFRKHLPTLYRAVFGFSPSWQVQSKIDGPYVDPQSTGALRQLSMLLNMTDLVPVVGDDQVGRLRELLTEAYGVVRQAESFPREMRFFLFNLLDEARRYVDEMDTFGSSKARGAILALCLELEQQGVQLEERGQEEEAGPLRRMARKLRALASTTFSAGAKRAGEIAASEATPKAVEAGMQILNSPKDLS